MDQLHSISPPSKPCGALYLKGVRLGSILIPLMNSHFVLAPSTEKSLLRIVRFAIFPASTVPSTLFTPYRVAALVVRPERAASFGNPDRIARRTLLKNSFMSFVPWVVKAKGMPFL